MHSRTGLAINELYINKSVNKQIPITCCILVQYNVHVPKRK